MKQTIKVEEIKMFCDICSVSDFSVGTHSVLNKELCSIHSKIYELANDLVEVVFEDFIKTNQKIKKSLIIETFDTLVKEHSKSLNKLKGGETA